MLKGVDISMWQGVGTGDGADFVIIKATEGNGYTDPVCDQHYQRAKQNGQKRGFYHFARPDLGNSGTAEADWFIDQCQGYFKDGIPVLDWEVNTWNVSWAKEFLDRVYQRTGIRPLIYMSASVVNGYNWSSVSKDYGLWIAGYPAKYDVANPPVPAEDELPYEIGSWAFACIWQYTSSAGRLDRDVAWLDDIAWSKYAGSYVAPKQEEKPAEKPKEEPKAEPEPVVEPTPEPAEEDKVSEEPSEENPIPAKKFDKKEFEKQIKKIKKQGGEMPFTLPQKFYEIGRWLLWLVVPTITATLTSLSKVLGWGWDTDTINTVVDICSVALGTILGIAKLGNDKKE